MIPKMDIQHYIYIILTLIYVPLIVQNWKFQNSPFKTTYIYIINSYICIFDWGKLEIPKLTIIVHIYILLNLIYVYQNGQNWKRDKI